MGIITAMYSLNTDDLAKYDIKDVVMAICYSDESPLPETLVYDKIYLDKTWYDFQPFLQGIASIPRDVYRGGKQTNVDFMGMDVGYWSRTDLVWVLQVAQAFWDGEDRESPRPITLQSSDLDDLFRYMDNALKKRLEKGDVWKMESGDPFTPMMIDYVFGALKRAIQFLIIAHEKGNRAIIQVSS